MVDPLKITGENEFEKIRVRGEKAYLPDRGRLGVLANNDSGLLFMMFPQKAPQARRVKTEA